MYLFKKVEINNRLFVVITSCTHSQRSFLLNFNGVVKMFRFFFLLVINYHYGLSLSHARATLSVKLGFIAQRFVENLHKRYNNIFF